MASVRKGVSAADSSHAVRLVVHEVDQAAGAVECASALKTRGLTKVRKLLPRIGRCTGRSGGLGLAMLQHADTHLTCHGLQDELDVRRPSNSKAWQQVTPCG
jgi:hypothetical protein